MRLFAMALATLIVWALGFGTGILWRTTPAGVKLRPGTCSYAIYSDNKGQPDELITTLDDKWLAAACPEYSRVDKLQ